MEKERQMNKYITTVWNQRKDMLLIEITFMCMTELEENVNLLNWIILKDISEESNLE